MNLRFFYFMANLWKKKFPRTPYETCKRGSRWLTLLKYENRSPKNCLPPMLSPSPKKIPKNGEIFSNRILGTKNFYLFIFWFCIENRLNKNQ
jgi:hypothetical protein